MARILIAGCGYVGTALATRLAADGHEVWGLRRDVAALPPGIRPLAADLTRVETLGCMPEGLDAVFYTAGAGRGDEASYRAIYLDGVSRLLDALADQGESPRRVFFTSSTSVYGQRRGEEVDEDSITEPSSFRGDLVLCGERLTSSSSFDTTVVRFGGIYGPGRTRMLEAVREGRIPIRPGEPMYTNRIHREDAAGVLRHLLGLPQPDGLYLGVDHEPADEAEVVRWLSERLGVAPPSPGESDPASSPRRSGSKRCSNARLLATGFRFVYPTFREGYAALLA